MRLPRLFRSLGTTVDELKIFLEACLTGCHRPKEIRVSEFFEPSNQIQRWMTSPETKVSRKKMTLAVHQLLQDLRQELDSGQLTHSADYAAQVMRLSWRTHMSLTSDVIQLADAINSLPDEAGAELYGVLVSILNVGHIDDGWEPSTDWWNYQLRHSPYRELALGSYCRLGGEPSVAHALHILMAGELDIEPDVVAEIICQSIHDTIMDKLENQSVADE